MKQAKWVIKCRVLVMDQIQPSEIIPEIKMYREVTDSQNWIGIQLTRLGRSPGEGKGYPLQYSGLKNAMDCIVHVLTKSRTRLSNFYFHFLYFLNKFIHFNWRLITLQYCIGFAIHQHESTKGVHVLPILKPLLPPSPSHPSGSSQCTSPEHSVSCMEPGLAICFTYDNIHVSMLFSQIIPLSPSPTESKSLFFTSVSFLLSRTQGHHYHLSKFHIYALIHCIDVFLSDLTSLCFIYLIRTDSNAFFLMAE